jgi:hypothetical protein
VKWRAGKKTACLMFSRAYQSTLFSFVSQSASACAQTDSSKALVDSIDTASLVNPRGLRAPGCGPP